MRRLYWCVDVLDVPGWTPGYYLRVRTSGHQQVEWVQAWVQTSTQLSCPTQCFILISSNLLFWAGPWTLTCLEADRSHWMYVGLYAILSWYTDPVLSVEGEQALLVFWYHPIFQCPLRFSEALHERVDQAIKLFGLTNKASRERSSMFITSQPTANHQLHVSF